MTTRRGVLAGSSSVRTRPAGEAGRPRRWARQAAGTPTWDLSYGAAAWRPQHSTPPGDPQHGTPARRPQAENARRPGGPQDTAHQPGDLKRRARAGQGDRRTRHTDPATSSGGCAGAGRRLRRPGSCGGRVSRTGTAYSAYQVGGADVGGCLGDVGRIGGPIRPCVSTAGATWDGSGGR
jgi:hypothetical protein